MPSTGYLKTGSPSSYRLNFWCVTFPVLLVAPKVVLHQMTSHQLKWIPKKEERAVVVRKMVMKLVLMS